VFCALVFTVKRSVDQLFMHYFHNFSSTSGGLDPAGGVRFRNTPGKNPAGAHVP